MKQGPGTKLVLKGLARAFPEIAAQRAREEQEERDQLQRSTRNQTSRHDDAEDQPGPSNHSRVGSPDLRSQTREHSRQLSSLHSHAAPEDFEHEENERPEGIRRRSSMRTNSRDTEYHSQSRDYSRRESVERGPSMYTNSRDPEGESRSRGHSRQVSSRRSHISEDFEREEDERPESIRRRSSMRTNSRESGYHSQSRGHSRRESVERGPSMYTNSRDPEGESRSREHSRVESIRRARSNYSRSLSTVEEIPIRRD